MSDVRLRVKLISAGFDEDVVFGTERAELMTTYVELLASVKLKVITGAVGGVGYDPRVERESSAFDQRKWEAGTGESRQREERNRGKVT